MVNVIKLLKSCINILSFRILYILEMLVILYIRYIGGVC